MWADDGWSLTTYRLKGGRRAGARNRDRAHVFFVQGSSDHSVLQEMEHLAGFVMTGMCVILVERRGVRADGSIDETFARKYATKGRRVQDTLDVMRAYLGNSQPGTRTIVVGFSEGGDVAASVAVQEPRVTHLALFGTGGWSQAEEIRYLVGRRRGYLGISSLAEFEGKLEEIGARPDSEEMWLGHTFRRWNSYMWHSPMNDVLRLKIPIFQAHGAKDNSVPVESARTTRDTMSERGKKNLQYVEYPTLDHQFRDVETGKSGLPLVEIDVLRWLAETGVLNDTDKQRYEERVRNSHPESF